MVLALKKWFERYSGGGVPFYGAHAHGSVLDDGVDMDHGKVGHECEHINVPYVQCANCSCYEIRLLWVPLC